MSSAVLMLMYLSEDDVKQYLELETMLKQFLVKEKACQPL